MQGRVVSLRHRAALREMAAGHGRRTTCQRRHSRCRARLHADLFRQRDVAEQRHHRAERARQFGDNASVGKNYDSAKLWIEHMLTLATDNLISKDSYGDWCVPPEEATLIHSKDPARQTDKTLLATSYFYYDLRLMEKYARLLGKTDDAARWGKLAEDFKTAFNKKFLDREKGQYSNGTQTSCVLPLAFGLVPEDMKSKIFAHLVDKIENETHGHIGTGLIGGQYLNRVLSDNGRADLRYTIASQKDYPSWGYMAEQGATTIWELWNGNTADPTMNSGNHVMLIGDLVVWFYEY